MGQRVEPIGTLDTGPEVIRPRPQFAGRLSQAIGAVAKRAFDVLASLIGLILLSPLFVFIGLLIKLDSPGPVFYRGERIGKDGKPFWMYKFRTMRHVLTDMGPRVTARDDPRVTRVGHILRDTKLNELPQLINVLKGEMSLVGPRPEDPQYVAIYTPQQRRVLSVAPGITSIASIIYCNEETLLSQDTLESTYVNVIMPDKLGLDIEYIAHRSFLVDLDIVFRTCMVLLPRFARAAPEVEEILFGPVQCFIRRRLSWFTLDLILGLGAVSAASLIWWRAGRVLRVRWPCSMVSTVGIALVFTFVNQICGLQRRMWSCASGREVCDIVLSTVFSTLLLTAINFLKPLRFSLPMEMVLLSGFFACVAFAVARYRSRLVTGGLWRWHSLWAGGRSCQGRQRLLIVGAGELGRFFAREVQHGREGQRCQIVGFVDDDLTKRGMCIQGIEVLGTVAAIPNLVARYEVDVIVVAADDFVQRDHQAVVDGCRRTPAQVKVVPDVLAPIREE